MVVNNPLLNNSCLGFQVVFEDLFSAIETPNLPIFAKCPIFRVFFYHSYLLMQQRPDHLDVGRVRKKRASLG